MQGEFMENNVLSQSEIRQFQIWGYVRVADALPMSFVEQVRNAVESESGPRNKEALDATAGVTIGERLHGAVDQILGAGLWRPLRTLGGLLYTEGSQSDAAWEMPASGWHFDNDPRGYQEEPDELMAFTYYNSVQDGGGATLALAGSHRYLGAGMPTDGWERAVNAVRTLSEWHPRLAALMGDHADPDRSSEAWIDIPFEVHGIPTRVVELTGEPGEAVLCHPVLLHAASPNARTTPRIMRRTNFRRKKHPG